MVSWLVDYLAKGRDSEAKSDAFLRATPFPAFPVVIDGRAGVGGLGRLSLEGWKIKIGRTHCLESFEALDHYNNQMQSGSVLYDLAVQMGPRLYLDEADNELVFRYLSPDWERIIMKWRDDMNRKFWYIDPAIDLEDT